MPKTYSTGAKCGQYGSSPSISNPYFAAVFLLSAVKWILALSIVTIALPIKSLNVESIYILSKYKNTLKSWPVTVSLASSPIQLPVDIKAKMRVVLPSAPTLTISELWFLWSQAYFCFTDLLKLLSSMLITKHPACSFAINLHQKMACLYIEVDELALVFLSLPRL